MSTQLIKSNDLQKLLKYKESLQSWGDIVQRTLSLELQFKGNANSLNIVIATVVNNIIFIITIIINIIIITKYKNGTSGRKFASVGEQSLFEGWICWLFILLQQVFPRVLKFSSLKTNFFPFCLGWLEYYFDFMVSLI